MLRRAKAPDLIFTRTHLDYVFIHVLSKTGKYAFPALVTPVQLCPYIEYAVEVYSVTFLYLHKEDKVKCLFV